MGWAAGRKLAESLANLRRILAVELVAAARAIDLRSPLRPAPATAAVVALVRQAAGAAGEPDRFVAPELAAVEALIAEGLPIKSAEEVTGPLR